jgi:hypothetical protein
MEDSVELCVGRGFLPRFCGLVFEGFEVGAGVLHLDAALVHEKVEKRAEHVYFKVDGARGNPAVVLLVLLRRAFDFEVINFGAGDGLDKFPFAEMPFKVL